MPDRSPLPVLLLAATLALAGCEQDEPQLPAACTAGADGIVSALRSAPAPVTLEGGTRLSTCIERARSDAEIQTLGSILTRAGDQLSDRMAAGDDAALQLGYLIGATRRGAASTNGIHLELVRRLEQTTGLDGAPRDLRTAFQEGLAAGSRAG